MFQLADGRQNVYQWDINVKLLLDESNESADEVHFSARFSRISLSVEVVHTADSSYVTIPNILLQKPNDIIAYSYITNADGSYTKYDTIIPVIARPKPSGYIYEETEILTWKTLDDKINDLGISTADAVKYTAQELTDEQKTQARTNIGAVSVDEVPEQVQGDWLQSDNTAPDFVKNRTHYTDTFYDSGYSVDFMDGTHSVGDILLLTAVSKKILQSFYIAGINAPYTATFALYLKSKVTYSGGTYEMNRECKDTVVSNGIPIIEIDEFSTGNIKALYYSSSQPYIAWYFVSDLTTISDEDKTKFPKTGIYAQVVNDLQSASSIQIGYRIKQYVKLNSKYINIPIATSDAPGVVKPVSKTDEMIQPVGVDENGALFTVPPGGSGVSVDDTLTISGAAADAKATGDKILALSDEIKNIPGDMRKSVYDPNNKAKDIFKYADDISKLAVTNHALSDTAHTDIRELITGLTNRLNSLADSDDTTLDQLSEIVAYIKSNKSLIDAITTEKVSVSDIIDNLTTNNANKPLSAAQGVALKALIDGIVIPNKLPNPNALTFTGAVTGSYDGSAAVTVEIPSGGGGSGDIIDVLMDVTIEEAVAAVTVTLDTPRAYKELYIATCVYGVESNSSANAMLLRVNNTDELGLIGVIAWIPQVENATSAASKSYGVTFVKLLHDCSFYYSYGSKSVNARTPHYAFGEMNTTANRETVISTLKFQTINQWTNFGVGSTIKIYGVRS